MEYLPGEAPGAPHPPSLLPRPATREHVEGVGSDGAEGCRELAGAGRTEALCTVKEQSQSSPESKTPEPWPATLFSTLISEMAEHAHSVLPAPNSTNQQKPHRAVTDPRAGRPRRSSRTKALAPEVPRRARPGSARKPPGGKQRGAQTKPGEVSCWGLLQQELHSNVKGNPSC